MLILMQGESGSGKSTLAKELAIKYDAAIYSTDDFHFIGDKYVFQGSKLTEFHKKNEERTYLSLKIGKNVIVDNTNIQKWQCRNYVKMAIELGHDIQFVRATGNFNNVHGVPVEKVSQMKANLEELTVEGCLKAKAPWEK